MGVTILPKATIYSPIPGGHGKYGGQRLYWGMSTASEVFFLNFY